MGKDMFGNKDDDSWKTSGGGGSPSSGYGQAGGSGIVMVRYKYQ